MKQELYNFAGGQEVSFGDQLKQRIMQTQVIIKIKNDNRLIILITD